MDTPWEDGMSHTKSRSLWPIFWPSTSQGVTRRSSKVIWRKFDAESRFDTFKVIRGHKWSYFDLWPTLMKKLVRSTSPILWHLEHQPWCMDTPWEDGMSHTKSRSLWPIFWHLTYIEEKACPGHNSYNLTPRNTKPGTWIHHGKAECCVPNVGHSDLYFDLWDTLKKKLLTAYLSIITIVCRL